MLRSRTELSVTYALACCPTRHCYVPTLTVRVYPACVIEFLRRVLYRCISAGGEPFSYLELPFILYTC